MDEVERIKLSILDYWGYRCALRECDRWVEHVHEIQTRGAGGDVSWTNSIPLCFEHHRQAHDGLISKEYLKQLLREGPIPEE